MSRVNNLNSSDRQGSTITRLKRYTFRGLLATAVCAALTYRTVTASESFTPDVAFQTVPPYAQVLVTAVSCGGGTLQNMIRVPRCGGGKMDDAKKNVLRRWIYYWTLTFTLLVVSSNWSQQRPSTKSGLRELVENVFQISLLALPLLHEMRFCHVCTEFKNKYRNLNKMIEDEHLTRKRLLAIREERRALNDRVAKTIGGWAFGAQVASEIATTAITTVYKIHRALRPATDRFEDVGTSSADLLDVLHRALRLFALCKVSGDLAAEANGIVSRLLNVAPSTDKNLENEISFFLWETVNPPSEVRMAYGTFALSPKLFVTVFSWCVGFILILLQFRWPRTTY